MGTGGKLEGEDGLAGHLPERRVPVTVTQPELVPLPGEDDPVHLGEHAGGPEVESVLHDDVQEPGARSMESPGARSKEQGARSKEQGA